ncbi:MAG: hypothetical protein HQK96_19760 [Nitrospirae bacterium]|nr:hypothetical protein [Nitrospirota bacterium]
MSTLINGRIFKRLINNVLKIPLVCSSTVKTIINNPFSLIREFSIILMLVLFSIVFACSNGFPSRTTKIGNILASPSKYEDRLVRVKGKVTESVIVFGVGYFKISDSTGAIVVIPSKTFPKMGEEVTINGQVKNAFVVGDKSLTVIIENSERKKLKWATSG